MRRQKTVCSPEVWVDELLCIVGEISPERVGALVKPEIPPVPLTVANEGPKLATVHVIMDGLQIGRVELE